MKRRVENICEKGKVEDELLNGEEERMTFNQWTKSFTPQNHPTVIKVLLLISTYEFCKFSFNFNPKQNLYNLLFSQHNPK